MAISFLGVDIVPISLGPDILGWVAPKETETSGSELIVRMGEQSFQLNVEELLIHINTSQHAQNRSALNWIYFQRRFTVALPDRSLEIYSGYVRLINDSTLTTLFNALSKFGQALSHSINSELNRYELMEFMLAYRELPELQWMTWAQPTWRGIDLDKMVMDSSVRFRSYRKITSEWLYTGWENLHSFSALSSLTIEHYRQGQTRDRRLETAFLFVQSEDEGFSENEHTLDNLNVAGLMEFYFPHSESKSIELIFFHANAPLADLLGHPLIPLAELSKHNREYEEEGTDIP